MNSGVRLYSLACDLAEMVPEASDVPHSIKERARHFRQTAPHLALLFSFVLSLQSAALLSNHTAIFSFYETVCFTKTYDIFKIIKTVADAALLQLEVYFYYNVYLKRQLYIELCSY